MTPDALQPKSFDRLDGQTRRLARFVSQLDYGHLPSKVIDLAKICVLDALSSTFLGSTLPWGKICIEYVRSIGGKSESTLVGSDVRRAAGNAALANGTMAHGFEVDDVYIPAIHHPGVVVVPAALAAAEGISQSIQLQDRSLFAYRKTRGKL
jgi:2-methylcitrate dehydratase PrpD